MKVPIDNKEFERFIAESEIFILTKEILYESLKNWYEEESEKFIEDMRADINTVIEKYRFSSDMISINKDFRYEPPLDTISGKITIYDSDGDYCYDERIKLFKQGIKQRDMNIDLLMVITAQK